MISYEAVDGPYRRWLADVKARIGERMWDVLQDQPAVYAQAYLDSKGIVPFKESVHWVRYVEACDLIKSGGEAGVDFPMSVMRDHVTLVPVMHLQGIVDEEDPATTGPDDAIEHEDPGIDVA